MPETTYSPFTHIRLVTHRLDEATGEVIETQKNFPGIDEYETEKLPDGNYRVAFTFRGAPCALLCSEEGDPLRDQIVYAMNPDTGRTRFRFPPFNRDK